MPVDKVASIVSLKDFWTASVKGIRATSLIIYPHEKDLNEPTNSFVNVLCARGFPFAENIHRHACGS
jgi:hypothetical protein